METLIKRYSPKKPYKEIPFTIFLGFWLTYAFARLLIHLLPGLSADINGVHIHHFSYGIIILTLVGFYSLVMNPAGRKLYKTAFFFGVALALTYDELGMWLKLTDDGVARFGYDAIALISIGFINMLYLDQHWRSLTRNIKSKLPKLSTAKN